MSIASKSSVKIRRSNFYVIPRVGKGSGVFGLNLCTQYTTTSYRDDAPAGIQSQREVPSSRDQGIKETMFPSKSFKSVSGHKPEESVEVKRAPCGAGGERAE
ncbi:hypothetical protein N7468_004979 [Penicillium chermesinum]|uniref:Uncharacterized protein n=1 Tax=Penicillium chermesinum TaxID=63820 RepID=A0A9W9NYA8_9EURO|nr:uncharacterized protein N7468_004979 [Penicillium chermesinum]KAJ5232023.1 hypothetical protein N7468_004979 [Penicillium chermesinum]